MNSTQSQRDFFTDFFKDIEQPTPTQQLCDVACIISGVAPANKFDQSNPLHVHIKRWAEDQLNFRSQCYDTFKNK